MKLEQSFEVDAPLERVWEVLVDVERVAPCLPGAAVTGRSDDGTYDGTFTIKVGPTTASYAGKLEMESLDEDAHRATMQAAGTDRRGQGGAKATIVSVLTPTDSGGTRVDVDTDYHITGRLARFGRGGMIEDISNRLLREFALRLQASLVADQGAAEEPKEPEAATEPQPEAAPEPEPREAAAASEPAPEPPEPAPETPFAGTVTSEAPEDTTTVEAFDAGAVVSSVMWQRLRSNPLPVAFVLGLLLAFIVMRRSPWGRA